MIVEDRQSMETLAPIGEICDVAPAFRHESSGE
jgi:hypothetical protein